MLIPIMDANNIRGREGRVCVKDVVNKEEEDEKEQGVENVVKAWSVFRVFPFACSPQAGPTWRHDPEANYISLTDFDFVFKVLRKWVMVSRNVF